MQKSFGVESVEVLGEAGSGKFEAIVSVFNNIDKVKDIVMPGAFSKAINEGDPPPVVWSHHWDIPPIGNTLDWGEQPKGLHIKGELFVGADDKHQYADMVYAAMKSREGRKSALREFSFAYDVPKDGEVKAEREVDGERLKVQELHTIFPVFEVGPTLKGCNPATEMLTPPKSFRKEDAERLLRIAQSRSMTLEELLDSLEVEQSVRREPYAGDVAELLLAFPDH